MAYAGWDGCGDDGESELGEGMSSEGLGISKCAELDADEEDPVLDGVRVIRSMVSRREGRRWVSNWGRPAIWLWRFVRTEVLNNMGCLSPPGVLRREPEEAPNWKDESDVPADSDG